MFLRHMSERHLCPKAFVNIVETNIVQQLIMSADRRVQTDDVLESTVS